MKILIIRFSSIGDIVLTSPVIRCLSRQKNAEIHYLTKKPFVQILEQNPYLYKVHALPERELTLRKWIKEQHFDLVLDLHHNLRTYALTLLTGTKVQRFDKLNIKKWLLVNFKINTLPPVHIVDRYIQTCRDIGIVNDNQGLDYFHGLDTAAIQTKYSLPEKYLVYSIGGQHETKKMPIEKVRQLAAKLALPLVLLGGKEDMDAGVKISGNIPGIIDLTGQCSLAESAAIIELSKAVYTHDTGLMHIASAFKKDVFSIWGNTVPELGMYPYMAGDNSRMFEVRGLACRPCSKIGHNKCPESHFKCMQDQDTEQLAAQSGYLS